MHPRSQPGHDTTLQRYSKYQNGVISRYQAETTTTRPMVQQQLRVEPQEVHGLLNGCWPTGACRWTPACLPRKLARPRPSLHKKYSLNVIIPAWQQKRQRLHGRRRRLRRSCSLTDWAVRGACACCVYCIVLYCIEHTYNTFVGWQGLPGESRAA